MTSSIRSGNDDLCVYQVLVEFRILSILVGGSDELMSLVLEPFADTELVLSCAEKLWDLFITMLVKYSYCRYSIAVVDKLSRY